METFRARSGSFLDQYYYEDREFEAIAADALNSVGLFPATPEPIRVERFIEKRFDIAAQYEDLPNGLLGFTRFGSEGAEEVVVSKALSEEGRRTAERRISSTLAHEAGHILLHAHLFALRLRTGARSLIEDDLDIVNQKVLCRDAAPNTPRYDGRWWEYQANQMIGALLLPRPLVIQALDPLLAFRGQFGIGILERGKREEAVQRLSDVFDVNPSVARIKVEQIYPDSEGNQLTL